MVFGDLQFFDIIIFAGIAIFLVYRLKKILGKKIGFDKTIGNNNDSQRTTKEETAIKTESLPELEENISKLEIAYKTISGFDHKGFIDGAKMAFETIINAFNKGDKKTLKSLLTPEVFKSFEAAIDSNNIDSDYQFYSLNIEKIESVIVEENYIKICIKFISEQFKNNDENTVVKKQDVWTFQKHIKSKNPNWLLSST